MTRAATHPSLPQNDTPEQKAAREAQIATACNSYIWTTEVPTLPGVPLAATVPSSDEPTIPWFLILIGVGLKIARNVIAVKLSGLDQGQVATLPSTLIQAQARCDADRGVGDAHRQAPCRPGRQLDPVARGGLMSRHWSRMSSTTPISPC